MADNEEVEGETVPELRESVVLALIAASLVGKRVQVNGNVSAKQSNDVVTDIETEGDEVAVIVYDDNRRVRIDGNIESIAVRYEPERSQLGSLFG